jgi:predicted MFS family arabinose efflux permease
MIIAVVLWGAGFTALPISLQAAVLRVAPEMPDTASSLYVVAFQIGIGGGALAGSALLGAGALGLIPDLALFIGGSLLAATARATFGGEPDDGRPRSAGVRRQAQRLVAR